MMLMMIDADGTIFTENSLRQDKGRKEYGASISTSSCICLKRAKITEINLVQLPIK